MLSSAAKRWSRTRSTSAAGAVSASSASDVAVTATCSLVPSVWAACARSATPPCSLMTCSERGCSLPLESTASRESAWTCRSARAELGKPLRGLPHGPHRVATTTASSFLVFNPDTQTGRRRVFIMTTSQTQRPTLVYVACFYPDLTTFAGLLLSRHSHRAWSARPIHGLAAPSQPGRFAVRRGDHQETR